MALGGMGGGGPLWNSCGREPTGTSVMLTRLGSSPVREVGREGGREGGRERGRGVCGIMLGCLKTQKVSYFQIKIVCMIVF